MKKNVAPVEIGEQYTVEIESITHNAEGVGRYKDFTVFVPVAIPGDIVQVKIVSTKKTYARGIITKVITPSPTRITPPCSVYSTCGGCQMQHQNYLDQLAVKRRIVEEALVRIGGLKEIVIAPVLGMEYPWNYRNKASFPISGTAGNVRIGFYQPRSHELVDITTCPIQHPLIDKSLKVLREQINALQIPPYDESKHTGVLRHFVIRVAAGTGELLIVPVVHNCNYPQLRQLATNIAREIPEVTGIVLNINNKRTNVIMGNEEVCLYGRDYIIDELIGKKFIISARSFYQVNIEQTPVLYQQAIDKADLQGDEIVIDAYCGTGTIGLMLADNAKQVIGVEVVAAAVEDAKRNAEINGIKNAEFHVGKAEEIIPRLVNQGLRPDVVVVDPPRKGCDEALLKAIIDAHVPKLAYVSCSPSTLARDLSYLGEWGYRVQGEVQPVDMFPHTSHVETVVSLML